jgi:hypothetical protein
MWVSQCARVRPRLPLLAGGELIGPDRRLAERHLIGCASCRRRLAELQGALGALHAAADHDPVGPASASLWPALARQIRESRRPALCWCHVEARTLVRTVVAAAAVLVLAVGSLSLWPSARQYKVTVTMGTGTPIPRVTVTKFVAPRPAAAPRRPVVRTASYYRRIRELPSSAEPAPAPRPEEDVAARGSAPAEPRGVEATH